MISGVIVNWCKISEETVKEDVVKFLMKTNDEYIMIRAKIPANVHNQLSVGKNISWHNPYVYLDMMGIKDVRFPKFGVSRRGRESYFNFDKESKI